MQVFAQVNQRGHEQVTYFYYPQVGLRAIVAIHNSVLGPALGGLRMRLYDDEARALDDVLRLSEGMTYKSSVAGLDLGGGKACIIADPHSTQGRRELLEQFGRCLNHLNGRYITAEDMGTSVDDMAVIKEVTPYVAGLSQEKGGSGDPSPWTALGVFHGMRAACERKFGTGDLHGRHVALQGVGHVGIRLLGLLKEAGARVTVCDTVRATLEKATSQYQVDVVAPEAIYDVACDVYAPCAAGQTVNGDTMRRLQCALIAGAANNQLSDPSVYPMLLERQISYCPDFVVNAGGIISVGCEYLEGKWNETWVRKKVIGIHDTVGRVLDRAKLENKFTEVVALEIARERIQATAAKNAQENRTDGKIRA